jgi:hypothetical protein
MIQILAFFLCWVLFSVLHILYILYQRIYMHLGAFCSLDELLCGDTRLQRKKEFQHGENVKVTVLFSKSCVLGFTIRENRCCDKPTTIDDTVCWKCARIGRCLAHCFVSLRSILHTSHYTFEISRKSNDHSLFFQFPCYRLRNNFTFFIALDTRLLVLTERDKKNL